MSVAELFNSNVLLEVSHQTMATKAAGKKRMTQSEVFNHFAEKTGMKRGQVKEFFDELYNLASGQVKSNGEFVLPGFGKLVKSERKAREGRNPATGETIQIPAKTTLKFRVGKGMKDTRSEEHTSELQSLAYLVCRLLLEKKKTKYKAK